MYGIPTFGWFSLVNAGKYTIHKKLCVQKIRFRIQSFYQQQGPDLPIFGGKLKISFWRTNTPRKTTMSHENQWLEDVFPIEIVSFLGNMLVFRGVTWILSRISLLNPTIKNLTSHSDSCRYPSPDEYIGSSRKQTWWLYRCVLENSLPNWASIILPCKYPTRKLPNKPRFWSRELDHQRFTIRYSVSKKNHSHYCTLPIFLEKNPIQNWRFLHRPPSRIPVRTICPWQSAQYIFTTWRVANCNLG